MPRADRIAATAFYTCQEIVCHGRRFLWLLLGGCGTKPKDRFFLVFLFATARARGASWGTQWENGPRTSSPTDSVKDPPLDCFTFSFFNKRPLDVVEHVGVLAFAVLCLRPRSVSDEPIFIVWANRFLPLFLCCRYAANPGTFYGTPACTYVNARGRCGRGRGLRVGLVLARGQGCRDSECWGCPL